MAAGGHFLIEHKVPVLKVEKMRLSGQHTPVASMPSAVTIKLFWAGTAGKTTAPWLGKKGSMASEQHGSKIKLFLFAAAKASRPPPAAATARRTNFLYDERQWRTPRRENTAGWPYRTYSGTVDRNRLLHSRGLVPLEVAGASAPNKIGPTAAFKAPMQCMYQVLAESILLTKASH